MASNFDKGMLKSYLEDYYKSLYPTKIMFEWLSYGRKPQDYIARREFAFIFEDDAHLRYQSFKNEYEFRTQLSRCQPFKVDIGAVFNHEPKDHKRHSDFRAQERELVFDIDLTDYDVIRNCCEGSNICTKCWRWIPIAVRVLDFLLREHFGFKHMLWIFSGRRGVHCWVADEVARKLSNDGRIAVAEYLSLIAGENKINLTGNKKEDKLHAMVEDSYKTIINSEDFEELVIEQEWLTKPEHLEKIMRLCEDETVRAKIHDALLSIKDAKNRWIYLKRAFDEDAKKEAQINRKTVPETSEASKHFLKAFVLLYAYPRLDVNVSTGINHLLKSPFCIHPATGNVAVPVNPKTIDRFKVSDVPRIDKLISEMKKISNQTDENDKENRKILYHKHTSLNQFVELFDAFVKNLKADSA